MMCLEDLAAAFNLRFSTDKTPGQIKSTCKNHSILCYRSKGELNKGRGMLLNDKQIDFVKANYASMSRQELTDALNKKFKLTLKLSQLIAFVKNHKIRSGRTGHFKKGQVPHNAGTKGLIKANSGSFKKGNSPQNRVPVGSTTVDTDGYHKTKVAEPNQWEFTHRMLWEKANGPIPNDHAVVFADSDRSNVALENLELISRSELSIRNNTGFSKLPTELRPVAKNIVKLRMKVFEIKRKKKKVA